jgi:iron complex transport system substrate-binding protein
MKKLNLMLSLLLIGSALLSACTSTATPTTAATVAPTVVLTQTPTDAATQTSGTLTLTDGLGRTVKLDTAAKRIVSLAPSVTEMLFAIGAGSQVIGRDSFSDYPAEVSTIKDVGGSNGNYSDETITALNPDLVIAAEINTADQVKSLENLGLKVYYLSNPVDFTDLFDEMATLGELTGHESDAKTTIDILSKRVQAVKNTVAKATSQPTVYYELDGTDPAKPYTAGPGSFIDLLITQAGGKNIGTDLSSQWAQISVEDLLVKNPNFIILGDSNYGITADQVAARTGWDKLTAVQKKLIYPFDDNLVSRAGPRMVDGLEALAKLIHPELFKDQAN